MINTIRRVLCKQLCPTEPEPHPFTVLRHRAGKHLGLVLRKQFPNANIHIRDRKEYSTLNLQEFNRWIQNDSISERQYHEDWYDCDNFADDLQCEIRHIARSLKTTLTVMYCEGYAPGGYHAFNLMLDTIDHIFIIEPQDDAVVPVDESNYKPDFIFL